MSLVIVLYGAISGASVLQLICIAAPSVLYIHSPTAGICSATASRSVGSSLHLRGGAIRVY